MSKEKLEELLAEGLSLEQIGNRLGVHASTVGYWLRKHGLEPLHRERHLARGGLEAGLLKGLVAQGLTHREIAATVDRSVSTVRYWLRRYGLDAEQKERRRQREAARQGATTPLDCPRHGPTRFVVERSGRVRCLKCRSEAVSRRRRRVKELLVTEAGGRCRLCGYDRCHAALQFHHIDPAVKSFGLGSRGLARSIASARAEASKCILLCSNCHAEVESGLMSVTLAPLGQATA